MLSIGVNALPYLTSCLVLEMLFTCQDLEILNRDVYLEHVLNNSGL